ncbi:MAG: Fe-S-containing protein [Lachnospiraceae bacterium]|nr:Fe-S-containing protein [Lachnospiraceae bacterium]
MWTYLIYTIKAILMAATITGIAVGDTRLSGKKAEVRVVHAGMLAGLAGAVIVALLRNHTSLIKSATLNTVIYSVSLTAFTIFVILQILGTATKNRRLTGMPQYAALSVFLAALMIYSFPEVMMYPYKILLSEKTVFSTAYLMNMIGILSGVVLSLLVYLAAVQCVKRTEKNKARALTIAESVILEVIMVSGIFSVLLQNGTIRSNHAVFSFVVFVKNHNVYFLTAALIVALIPATGLLIRGLHVNEPYNNPAEHRKILAKWRKNRRWAATLVLFSILGFLTVTVMEDINSREVTLSPVEDIEYDEENMYVPFDMVSDGHLHRFAYTTESGTQIRFIVIKKPNSQSYGVGLDACDICGEAGYYERDGQVVCKRCDVIMNISTIGFKGGCNPIVIPYEIKNSRIIVPISGLVEHEKKFRK